MTHAPLKAVVSQSFLLNALIFFVISLSILAYGGVGASIVLLLTWLLSGICLVGLVRCWRSDTIVDFSTAYHLPICLAAGLALLSLFYTQYVYVSVDSAVLLFVYIVFFFLCYYAFERQQNMLLLLSLFLGFLFVYAVVGLLLINHSFFDASVYAQRYNLSLSFVSHNQFAGMMQIGFWLSFLLAIHYRGHKQLMAWCVALIFALAVVLSLSRGAWMAFIMTGILFLLVFYRRKKAFSYKILLLPIALLVFILPFDVSPIIDRLMTVENVEQASEGRFSCWQGSLLAIADHLWWGTGIGTYQYIFPAYQTEDISHMFFDHAHNDYLELMLEMGVPGALLLMLFLYVLYVPSWRFIVRRSKNHDDRLAQTMVLAALLACTSMLLHSLVDFNFHIIANTLVFVFCLALIARCIQQHQPDCYDAWLKVELLSFRQLSPLWLLAALFCMFFSWQNYRAYHALELSQQAVISKAWNDMQSYAQQAEQHMPYNIQTKILLADALRTRATQMKIDYDQDRYLRASLKYIDEAIDLFPGDAALWYKKGTLLQSLGQQEGVIDAFEQAVHYSPTTFYYQYALAFALLSNADVDRALKPLSAALRLYPSLMHTILPMLWRYHPDITYLHTIVQGDSRLLTSAATFLLQQGLRDHAMAFMQEALTRNHHVSQASKNLHILWRSGEHEAAIALGEQYLRQWPNERSLIRPLGYYYNHLQQPEKTELMLEPYVRRHIDDHQAASALLGSYLKQKNYDSALSLVRKMIEQERSADNYLLLLQVYRNMKMPYKALKAAKAGLQIDMTHELLHYYMGLVYEDVKMEQLAMTHWRECLANQACQKAYERLKAYFQPSEVLP